jgi:hypothetical protein
VKCGNMGRVKTPWQHLEHATKWSFFSLGIAFTIVVSGCIDPNSQLITTPPVEDPVIETAPLSDDDVEEEGIAEEVVFASIQECLQGNWEVNNDAFAEFFAETDDRVVAIDVEGLATMTIENGTYRMFFTEWDIRYDTGDPTFLESREGNETVQFVVSPDGVVEVVERDDQIIIELFSIVGEGDGEAIAIATNDPGPLPLDGSTLQCTATTLQVFVEQESFFFDRR